MNKNLLLLCGALLLVVLTMEVALRLFGISYPYFTQVDEFTGHALRPRAEGWQRDEGEAYVTINSAGLRDREHTKEKPEGVYRIAILGDSYAEAKQVEMGDTFWSVLERELTECMDHSVEVINFGVSGFSTTQELEMLKSRVWEYDPDLVLLAFFAGNDVRNNSHTLSKHKNEPYYELVDEELKLNTSFRETPFFHFQRSRFARTMHWLVNRSRMLQVVNRVRTAHSRFAVQEPGIPLDQLWSGATSLNSVEGFGAEEGIDIAIYEESNDPDWIEAWQITEKILLAMHEEVQRRSAKFLVVMLSTSIQAYPDDALRNALKEHLGVSDLFYPDRRIADVGREHGFPVLTLAPSLQQYAKKSQAFLHGFDQLNLGFGHWNKEGHRVAGELISQYSCVHLR